MLPVLLASCSSSTPRGLPRKLPVINLQGSPQTPPHSMPRKDYPFDPNNGNYVIAWAAEGESAASASDLARWQASHGGSVSRKQPSPVRKVSSSSKKTTSRTTTYTIKSGDTLSGIARKHSTTVAKIKAANGLKSDLIRAGKTLKIPR
ncbi:LysM peptidoglycan-binding domain-containing protein [Prosthecobacter sp. SYSU 5D2]|uniref:LysM peptidoglycan-binding domain-containing protein n=1 Tax=Prosthecobacter sp. SYSU 5D2 TaxID=3134134 RepID=UPI0031FF0E85